MAESCGQEQTRWKTTVITSTALQDHDISTVLQRQQHRVRYSESVETGSVIFPLSGIAFMLSDTQDFLRTGEEEFSKRIQKFINIHRNSFLVLSAALHGPEEWSVMFRIQRRNKQDKRQWTETDAQEVPPEHEEEVLYSEGESTATDCPEGVESLSLEIFQNHLDAILCSVLWDDPAKTGRFLGSNLRVIPVHNPAETVKLMLTMAKVTSKPQADDTRCKIDMTKAQIIEKSPVWKMLQEYQWHCN